MTLKNQSGSALAILVFGFGVAALMTIASAVLISSYYLKLSKTELLMQSSFSAYESCLGLFNNTIDQTAQINVCGYGQCLNLQTGLGCTACGSADAQLTVGDDCYCQLKYYSTALTTVDFEAAGICDNGKARFQNEVSLDYCQPVCAGLCGGQDSCGGICPNTCVPPDSKCSIDNMTCCDPFNPGCI